MKKYKIKFVIWLVVALFAVTACGKREQSDDQSSSGQETEARISEEEKTQLLRRIDYALLGQGPYTERALRSYLIADADDDGVEELFVDCGRETDRETLFAFDFREDGTPFGLCHANRSATGGSEFQVKNDGKPVLMSSFASMGAGTTEEYSYWNGSVWEIFATSHAVYDFDAMKYTDDPVYLSQEATYEGEPLTQEAFEARIEDLQLQPFSNELSDLFTVEWPDEDLTAFAGTYDDHLEQLECKGILRIAGDIDQDGETEALWCVEGPSFLWNQNMEYQDPYNPMHDEDIFFFSDGRGADLVMADPGKGEILIYTARLGIGLIEDLELEDGLLTFTYSEGKSTQFQYDGVDQETGMLQLKEYIPVEEEYLREGVWYEFSPHDTFVDVYHFSDSYSGYTTQRLTDTGEKINYGKSFDYTVSDDGKNVTIQFNGGGGDSYTYYPDTEYGAALASEIRYDRMPDGSQVSYQSIIWRYDTPPTAEQLAKDAIDRRPARISASAESVGESNAEKTNAAEGLLLTEYLGLTVGSLKERFGENYSTDWYGGGQYISMDGTNVLCFADNEDPTSDSAVVTSVIGDGGTFLYGRTQEGGYQVTLEEMEAFLGQTLTVQDGMGEGEYWAHATWEGYDIQIIFSMDGETYTTLEVWVRMQ